MTHEHIAALKRQMAERAEAERAEAEVKAEARQEEQKRQRAQESKMLEDTRRGLEKQFGSRNTAEWNSDDAMSELMDTCYRVFTYWPKDADLSEPIDWLKKLVRRLEQRAAES